MQNRQEAHDRKAEPGAKRSGATGSTLITLNGPPCRCCCLVAFNVDPVAPLRFAPGSSFLDHINAHNQLFPLWGNIREIVQRRIRERLTDGEYLFPRAKVMTFDNAIARACRKAAKLANINYGQANSFTCHSFRHTFATDLMEKTGNDAGTVMWYTGHKTIEGFSIYLKPTDRGRILATQAMNSVVLNVDGSLTGSEVDGVNEVEQVSTPTRRILSKNRGVVVS